MPIKKTVLSCDICGNTLSCVGGYVSSEDSLVATFLCSECEKFYISINGEFAEGTWDIVEAEDAEEIFNKFTEDN